MEPTGSSSSRRWPDYNCTQLLWSSESCCLSFVSSESSWVEQSRVVCSRSPFSFSWSRPVCSSFISFFYFERGRTEIRNHLERLVLHSAVHILKSEQRRWGEWRESMCFLQSWRGQAGLRSTETRDENEKLKATLRFFLFSNLNSFSFSFFSFFVSLVLAFNYTIIWKQGRERTCPALA